MFWKVLKADSKSEDIVQTNNNGNNNQYAQYGLRLNRNVSNSGHPGQYKLKLLMIYDNKGTGIEAPSKMTAIHIFASLSKLSFNKITYKDLTYCSYQMEKKHQLKPEDYPRRETFSRQYPNAPIQICQGYHYRDEPAFQMDGCPFVYIINRHFQISVTFVVDYHFK